MNDVGLAIEFIDYDSPWIANYCTLVDISTTASYVITESGSIIVGTENSGSVITEAQGHSISQFNIPYYGLPFFVNITPTSASENSSSYALGLDQSDYDFTMIRDGLYIDSDIRFNPNKEEKNVDETYKRIIYNQIKNLYYSDAFNPTTTIGSNNQFDIILDGKNQILYKKLKTVNIPQSFFGEKIVENSVEIKENRGLIDYTIIDDGNGNLYAKDRMFSVIVDDQNRGDFDTFPTASSTDESTSASAERFLTRRLNMGYGVAISDDYAAISVPCFEYNIPQEGFVEIYNYDKNVDDRFTYLMTLKHQEDVTHPVYDILTAINTDFGRSVDVCNTICAVSVTKAEYYFTSSFGSDIFSSSTLPAIEIYDLSVAPISGSPVLGAVISASMLDPMYETGSNTFGQKISINDEFIVIGCPYTYLDGDSYKGSVYVFSGSISSGYTFSAFLTGSDRSNDVLFGKDLKIDKKYNKLIVGNGNYNQLVSSKAYLFEFISGSWVETYAFSPTKTTENLNFIDVAPNTTSYDFPDAFGTSVSIYCSSSFDYTIAIGSPFDRVITEYSGSSCDKNGAVYIYEHQYCIVSGSITDKGFGQTRISGNELTFKQNRFGHSVDIHKDKLVISSPKYLSEFPPNYFAGTFLENNLLVPSHSDNAYIGMFHIYEKTGISIVEGCHCNPEWLLYATYKPRKLYGNPYCFFAYDTAIFNDNLIVGNPIVLASPMTSTNTRPDILYPEDITVDIQVDKTQFVFNLQGNFNIFNVSDYESQHHIGNVFYKSGKLVISTSGSIFDTMFETTINDYPVYDIEFKNKIRLHEKEIICTVNPGEFNYSTNPTSYNYDPIAPLDLNKNGDFDFDDCDKILRGMYYKFTGTETWWELFDSFSSTSDYDTIVENSLFNYYVTNSPQKILLETRLTDGEKSYIINDLNQVLDINGDKISDYSDIKLLWKYFVTHLTAANFIQYQTSKSISGVRPTYDSVVIYLDKITGKSSKPKILDTFYSGSTSPTSSYLTPYVTTIGLYNGADLIAVAKLGTPIKNIGYFPLCFIVRFDM